MIPFARLSPQEHTELGKLRSEFPEWDFSAISGRWVAEKHMADGLIIIEKRDPQLLRARIGHYDSPA
jgi:hypothetical protein